MANIAHIQLANTVYDLKDNDSRTLIQELTEEVNSIPGSDLEVKITPEVWEHTLVIPANQGIQGMTTDGTYLYYATVDNSNDPSIEAWSNPKMHRVNLSTGVHDTPKTLPKAGHYNNLNYYGGYIYCTGINADDTPGQYKQIYKYNYSTNTGTAINIPSGREYWNFAIGDTVYNTRFAVGHVGKEANFDVLVEPYPGKNSLYPYSVSPVDYYNGVEQGCAIFNDTYICTLITDRSTFDSSPIDSNDEIRVQVINGIVAKRISIDNILNKELEDICFVGNKAYINASDGHVYIINDFHKLFHAWYEATHPTYWYNPCFIYVNENGSESYDTGSYGGNTGTLLKSFKVAPWTYQSHLSNAEGEFVIRGNRFPFKINPTTPYRITCHGSFIDGNYNYDVFVRYDRSTSSDESNYVYTVSHIWGYYRNASGTLTTFDVLPSSSNYQTILNNVFFKDSAYINNIVADPTTRYSYTGMNI